MTTNRRNFLAAGSSALVLAGVAPALANARMLTVYKDPNCGCCHLWAEALKRAGFDVVTKDLEDLGPIKARFGVPGALEGCHTAEIDGYFLEGHVPLSSVRRLLAERSSIKGLAVAGMPSGSLGMGDDPEASYDVMAVSASGNSVFEQVRPKG